MKVNNSIAATLFLVILYRAVVYCSFALALEENGGYGDYIAYSGPGGLEDDVYMDAYEGETPSAAGAKALLTNEDIQEFIEDENSDPIVIGYFDTSTSSADKELFLDFAKAESHNFRFGFSTAEEILQENKYEGSVVFVYPPSKFVNPKYEELRSRYPSKSLERKSLERFLYDKSHPLVGLKSFKSSNRYEKSKLPVLTLFAEIDYEKNEKQFNYYANRLRKVAKEFKGRILFSMSRKTLESESDYGLSLPGRGDVGMGIKTSDGMHYKLEGPFSSESVRDFCKSFLAGTLVGGNEVIDFPPARSESEDGGLSGVDKSGEDESSPVVMLSNENFKREVLDSDNDVMVEFYAPWCGHCKALKPIYRSVAEKMSAVSTVLIGAMDVGGMDSNRNTVPKGFKVQGYPTLYFVTASDKRNPILYNGKRDEASIIDFIKFHATHPVFIEGP